MHEDCVLVIFTQPGRFVIKLNYDEDGGGCEADEIIMHSTNLTKATHTGDRTLPVSTIVTLHPVGGGGHFRNFQCAPDM